MEKGVNDTEEAKLEGGGIKRNDFKMDLWFCLCSWVYNIIFNLSVSNKKKRGEGERRNEC